MIPVETLLELHRDVANGAKPDALMGKYPAHGRQLQEVVRFMRQKQAASRRVAPADIKKRVDQGIALKQVAYDYGLTYRQAWDLLSKARMAERG